MQGRCPLLQALLVGWCFVASLGRCAMAGAGAVEAGLPLGMPRCPACPPIPPCLAAHTPSKQAAKGFLEEVRKWVHAFLS